MFQKPFRIFSFLMAVCLVLGLLTPASASPLGVSQPNLPASLPNPDDPSAESLPQLLLNRGFNTYTGASKIPTNWRSTNFSTTDGKSLNIKREGLASVRLSGQANSIKSLRQDLLVTGGGERMTFSFWAKGASIPTQGVCRGQVIFYNGATVAGTQTVNCQTGTYDWMLVKTTFTAPKAYTKIITRFVFSKANGTIWLDLASLVKAPISIRWFVGLGTGTNPEQIAVQQEVVNDFNASQNRIKLTLEVVPYPDAYDTLATQIAAGNGPDIVGPVGWGGSHRFHGQWLDMAPYITQSGFDTSIFEPALVEFYQTDEGQVGLPFAVFPGAIYFIPDMFDQAGLAYPPQTYGEKYFLDGAEVDWTWDVVTEVAKRLTLDENGKNATEVGFDRNAIVQVGYSPQWQSLMAIGTFHAGAADILSGSSKGSYHPNFSIAWKSAWQWYYDGIWGSQPFMATGPMAGSPDFGSGNVFNSGKAAMALSQVWYTCCLSEFVKAGNEFQLGIQPMGADGKVHGRMDADTFRIWKGSKRPKEAFEAMAYLITTGADKLLPIYGAMPAIASKTQAFFDNKSTMYPFVTQESWDVFVQGLAYPDTPSAEQYMPNYNEANARLGTFLDLMNNTESLNFETEYQDLMNDLDVIFNQ